MRGKMVGRGPWLHNGEVMNQAPAQERKNGQKHIIKKKERLAKTYNSWDSHVVTHHTTNQPACGLSTAERTGSPVFHTLWSYVPAVTNKGTICQVHGALN